MQVELVIGSDNYVKVYNIATATGDAISSYSSVTAALFSSSDTTRASALTNSSINLSAVDGEDDSYEGVFPPTVDLQTVLNAGNKVICQVVVTCTVDGNTRVLKTESRPVAPSRGF